MATSLTKTDVYNLSLDVIREAPITSLADTGPVIRWLNRHYDQTVSRMQRRYTWNFCKELHSLSKDAADPEFRWLYRYKLPGGWLRVLPFTEYGKRGGRPVEHEVIGNYIYTDHVSPIYVTLLMRRLEPGDWDDLFVDLVSASLAVGLARKFTQKAKYLSDAIAMLDRAQADAEEIDTYEGSAEPVEQHDIIRVRS